jgi:hypothetical protein
MSQAASYLSIGEGAYEGRWSSPRPETRGGRIRRVKGGKRKEESLLEKRRGTNASCTGRGGEMRGR